MNLKGKGIGVSLDRTEEDASRTGPHQATGAMPQPDALRTVAASRSSLSRESGLPLSAWSASKARRVFDIAVVALLSPMLVPLLLVIAAAVRISSPGPALFRQTRIGQAGKPFTILKFRTMLQSHSAQVVLATAAAQQITPLGRVLRWLKFDELPQCINVFRGDMSLVGPRPRIARYHLGVLLCRPGITSPATLAFAREEAFLALVPPESLERYYLDVVQPIKHDLDSGYMARATLLSDVRILFRTAFGRWEAAPAASRAAAPGPIPSPRRSVPSEDIDQPLPAFQER